MKKIFLIIVCIILFYPVSSKDLKTNIKFDNNGILSLFSATDSTKGINNYPEKVLFGFKLGTGLSNTNFNQGFPKPAISVHTNYKPSFQTSFYLEIPLFKKISLQQEYGYARLSGETEKQKIIYNLSYLSLPVLLKYSLSPKLLFEIGPQFDLLMLAQEQMNENATNIIHEVEERNIAGIIGLEYRFNKNIGLDARIIQGLNHVNIKQGSESKEFKWQMIQLFVKINLNK